LRLKFRGTETVQPLLSRLSRDLNVDLSILQGSVGRIKDSPYGQLVVAVQGEPDTCSRLPGVLRAAGVQCEELHQ